MGSRRREYGSRVTIRRALEGSRMKGKSFQLNQEAPQIFRIGKQLWSDFIRLVQVRVSLTPWPSLLSTRLCLLTTVRKPNSNHSLSHAGMHLVSVMSSLIQVMQRLIAPHQQSKCMDRESSVLPRFMLAQRSLYPRIRLSRPLSATAQDQARPASPPNRLSGQEDFSSMPSLSMDFISWPVV